MLGIVRYTTVLVLTLVSLVLVAACGDSTPDSAILASTPNIEATAQVRIAEERVLEEKAHAMAKSIVEATVQAMPTLMPTSTPEPINQGLDSKKHKLQEINEILAAENTVLQGRLEELEIVKNAAEDLLIKVHSQLQDLVQSEQELQEINRALQANNDLLEEKLKLVAKLTPVPTYTPTPTSTAQ